MISIKRLGNPILKTPCKEVTNINGDVLRVADKLRFAMLNQNAHGIAANQIGSDKAMFVYTWEKTINKVLVNPQIINKSDIVVPHEEGCLSIPDYRFIVDRAESVEIEALNLKGDTIIIEAQGMLAYIFQHEIDHLNGVMLTDKISAFELAQFEKKWRK